MLKMSTHFNALTEAFDKPYKFSKQKLYKGFVVYRFFTADRSEVDVLFKENEISDEESYWVVNFERDGRQDQTGEGDAMRIFATVIEILKDFTKKDKPQEIGFSAEKPAERTDTPPRPSKEKQRDGFEGETLQETDPEIRRSNGLQV